MPDHALSSDKPDKLSRSVSPTADVASAMGFASFGAKPHLAKKRKKGNLDSEGSGSNSLPLGLRSDKRANEAHHTPIIQEASLSPQPMEHDEGDQHSDGQKTPGAGQIQPFDGTPQRLPCPVSGSTGQAMEDREEGKLPNGKWDWHALRQGIRNKRGDMVFYDASFVEDPWAALKSNG
ncbi:MAG: hypothetical protein Q9163_003949 [Psora crenata]